MASHGSLLCLFVTPLGITRGVSVRKISKLLLTTPVQNRAKNDHQSMNFDWPARSDLTRRRTTVVQCSTLQWLCSHWVSYVVHPRRNRIAGRVGERKPARPRRANAAGIRGTTGNCGRLPAERTAGPHAATHSGRPRSLHPTRTPEKP